ncbi:hypothetical protein [Streptomyces sp. NPDC057623]|uniref:hypothetical protein n=1 Tax=Streptomyces sp. NPDC057623 TaxID=3346187 RepID=UPI0036C496BC
MGDDLAGSRTPMSMVGPRAAKIGHVVGGRPDGVMGVDHLAETCDAAFLRHQLVDGRR